MLRTIHRAIFSHLRTNQSSAQQASDPSMQISDNWKQYLRRILLHYFIQNKSAAEAHRILVETDGGNALSDTTCRDWFRCFKYNDFKLDDIERSGTLKKFQEKEVQEIHDQDRSQTLVELGKTL